MNDQGAAAGRLARKKKFTFLPQRLAAFSYLAEARRITPAMVSTNTLERF
jgi:hypothetical protein